MKHSEIKKALIIRLCHKKGERKLPYIRFYNYFCPKMEYYLL